MSAREMSNSRTAGTGVLAAAVGLVTVLATGVAADGLPALPRATEAGWRRYVQATEARRAGESGSGRPFLALAHRDHPADRAMVRAGEVVIRAEGLPGGASIEVPGAQVHHWRGAVFLPGATVDGLVRSLEQGPPRQVDVLRAKVLSRAPPGMHVYLRIRRQQVVTVVLDTEHIVHFARHGGGRASSSSRAVHIAEVRDAGTASEQILSDADDRDFLWRLHAYWRYEQVEGGVIAECESISLSRDVPLGLRLAAGPLITRTAESSMGAALKALLMLDARSRLSRAPPLPTPPALSPAR